MKWKDVPAEHTQTSWTELNFLKDGREEEGKDNKSLNIVQKESQLIREQFSHNESAHTGAWCWDKGAFICVFLPHSLCHRHLSSDCSLLAAISIMCNHSMDPDSGVAVRAVSPQRQRHSLHFNAAGWKCAERGWSAIHYQQRRTEADCLQEIITGQAHPPFLPMQSAAWKLCCPESIALLPCWGGTSKYIYNYI